MNATNPNVKHIVLKYKLLPNDAQQQLFLKTFGCCRKVYTLMLDDKKLYYEQHHTNLRVTPTMYKKEHPYFKEVDSLALANVL